MDTLGLNATTAGSTTGATTAPAEPSKRIGLAQAILFGSGFAGGGTIVLGAIELVRSEPDKAFRLLHDWGPWCFLAMLVTYALSKVATRALDVAERVGDRLAGSMEDVAAQQRSLAEAGHMQALALQATADKDDRDKQEVQILIGVVNSKVEQTLDEQKRVNRALERIEDALNINRPKESDAQ
jgi:hypothetical protein